MPALTGTGPAIGLAVARCHARSRVPPRAEAQHGVAPYRIGVLNEALAANHPTVEGLKAGLRELGLEEGRDVDVRHPVHRRESRRDAGRRDGARQGGVDLIFTSHESADAGRQGGHASDPDRLHAPRRPGGGRHRGEPAAPGGNVTGVSSLQPELVAKRLELLKTLVPGVRRVWRHPSQRRPERAAAMVARR